MIIQYATLADGAFVALVADTNISAYAYATSPNADRARTIPARVAREMIARAIEFAPTYVAACGYNALRDTGIRDRGMLDAARAMLDAHTAPPRVVLGAIEVAS